ncbi:hypothetical protein GCM10010211_81140 [Streptomyces albospinus]|uniref:Uncharacterized protein n=1 Tax=Streptomyces albospinus TaxID=285515 RepID=A0ABQ2VP74_9ACTN|nr:hypothetical protein GCM10010211_81140 [Streptomyces albospinus]
MVRSDRFVDSWADGWHARCHLLGAGGGGRPEEPPPGLPRGWKPNTCLGSGRGTAGSAEGR